MKVAIIGSLSSGRSTLFEALTGQGAASASAGVKTRLGIAKVKDERIDRLTALYKPKKTVYAEIALAVPPADPKGPVDIKGIREMRDVGAFVHVVGAYTDGGDSVEDTVAAALTALNAELVLADMERAEKRLGNIRKAGGSRPGEEELLTRAVPCLEAERPLRTEVFDEAQVGLMDELGLTSQRPLLTVVNVGEANAARPVPQAVLDAAATVKGGVLWLCATLEAELASMDPKDQGEFLSAYGLEAPASVRFVKTAFDLLQRICFFTVGPDEVRAWPIPRDTVARRAARAIHTDLEKGFIRAEVVDYETLLAQGSEAKCKAAGVLRVEGKDYVVQDGDVINVRFNI